MSQAAEKRLMAKEDINFDLNGTNEGYQVTDGSGNPINLTKLNASHIPILKALRLKVGSATEVNGALDYLADLINDIGSATQSKQGLIEIANNAEMLALTDSERAATPAGLGALIPSETQRGLSRLATSAEQEAASSTVVYISPSSSSSETKVGVHRVGTQAEVDAGSIDTVSITPKKLRWGFSASLSTTGHIAFPSWLGGVIIQWGNEPATASLTDFSLSTSFLSAPFVSVCSFKDILAPASSFSAFGTNPLTQIRLASGNATRDLFYITIGV